MMAQAQLLKALSEEDSSFVEASEGERASLDVLVQCFEKMAEDVNSGSKSFQNDKYREEFV